MKPITGLWQTVYPMHTILPRKQLITPSTVSTGLLLRLLLPSFGCCLSAQLAGGLLLPWLVFNVVSCAPCLLATLGVAYLSPLAAGSGIPHIKAYCRGVEIPGLLVSTPHLPCTELLLQQGLLSCSRAALQPTAACFDSHILNVGPSSCRVNEAFACFFQGQ